MFNLSYLSYLKEMYIFIDKRYLFKPFSYEIWVCYWTICFKNLIISPHLEKILPSGPPPKFYILHQRLISPLNNNFHVKSFIFSCSHCCCTIFILMYYFHFTFALFAYTGHANFDFNQYSIFTDCCFAKVWTVKKTPPS